MHSFQASPIPVCFWLGVAVGMGIDVFLRSMRRLQGEDVKLQVERNRGTTQICRISRCQTNDVTVRWNEASEWCLFLKNSNQERSKTNRELVHMRMKREGGKQNGKDGHRAKPTVKPRIEKNGIEVG